MNPDVVDNLELLAAARSAPAATRGFRPDLGVAIRATNTAPRGWRGPPLVHVRSITPSPKVAFDKSITDAEAEQLYLRQLDDLGDVVVGDLAIVARQHPGQALIVLCFEDVEAGESCHRRWVRGLDARPLRARRPRVGDSPARPGRRGPSLFDVDG